MKKSIVITSIFEPTKAIQTFGQLEAYDLIVIGDILSPDGWFVKNITYILVKTQSTLDFRLVSLLPFNHYSRKMIGYLLAIHRGSDFIIDTDDDNIPKQDWSFPIFNDTFDCLNEHLGFVNIYQCFTSRKIWPRGFPLKSINDLPKLSELISQKDCKVGIWQGLVDEDPDVDAIYRLTCDLPFYFNERNPVVLGKGTVSPFNSQNTMIINELFPLLYLPKSVTFDSLISYGD